MQTSGVYQILLTQEPEFLGESVQQTKLMVAYNVEVQTVTQKLVSEGKRITQITAPVIQKAPIGGLMLTASIIWEIPPENVERAEWVEKQKSQIEILERQIQANEEAMKPRTVKRQVGTRKRYFEPYHTNAAGMCLIFGILALFLGVASFIGMAMYPDNHVGPLIIFSLLVGTVLIVIASKKAEVVPDYIDETCEVSAEEKAKLKRANTTIRQQIQEIKNSIS